MKVDKRSFRCIYLLFVLVLLLFDFCVPLNKQNNKIVDSKELKKGSSSNKNNNIVRKKDEKLDDGDKHNLKKSQHFISLQDSENDDDESTILIEKNGKNLSAQEITEKLWENMIIQTKKAGQMFRDDIPAWDDISIGVINSPPLI